MKKFERVEVGYINTPIEYLGNLSKELDCNIYVKRDDLTGLALGGNKTRKLDYIVKDALDNGYTTLLTYGAAQTNHGRLTIAAAAKFGMKSILIIEGEEPKKAEGNVLLDAMMDATLVFIDKGERSEEEFKEYKQSCVENIIKDFEANNEKVYEVPMGGSSALGSFGYFECAREIVEQTKDKNIKYLFCGYGSTGTFAGLWLGAKYYKADFEIIGVPVFPTPFSLENCADLVNELASNLEIDIRCTKDDFNIIGGLENNKYAMPEYGKSSYESREAMLKLARTEALITDPVYSGKTAYGMLDYLENNDIEGDVLFLHTGGYPALFVNKHTDDMQGQLWDIIEEN